MKFRLNIRALEFSWTLTSGVFEVNISNLHFVAWDVLATGKLNSHGSPRCASYILEAHILDAYF
jgi:hypothetical protein